MNNLVILNHFYGYPSLEDEFSNKQRYAKLLKLVDIVDSENTIFLTNSTKDQDNKLESIRQISQSYNHKWLDYKDNQNIEEIISAINEINSITVSPETTNIVLSGTNTAGCLLRTSFISAKEWASRNFNVHFCLSMCADYELDGVNTAEKNQMAAAIMYSYIKNNKLTNNINVCYDPRELDIKENTNR